MGDQMKHAMSAVLEGMGRAAREGRARRFQGKRPAKSVDVTMGEVTLEPTTGADVEVDPVKEAGMSNEEMQELMQGLEIRR